MTKERAAEAMLDLKLSEKSHFKMYIPNFFSSNKYMINVNVTFMHLSIKQVMHVEFNLINIYR